MSVLAAELIFYGSANMPEADSLTTGGAIQTNTRVIFDSAVLANAPSGILGCSSDDAADTTQTLTVTGRDAAGIIVSEAFSVNGLTNVSGTQYFERILKCVIDAHNGSVTLRDKESVVIGTLESGVLTLRRPFYNVSSDVVGGSARNFYEKVFLKNTNASLALLSAQITESADPSANLTFTLASGQNDAETTADRQTAPVDISAAFSGTTKTLLDTNLPAGSGIGVWLNLALDAGEAAAKTTYTMGVQGNSI